MIRKINRVIQDLLRPIRLQMGRKIWDKKTENHEELIKNNKVDMGRVKSILFLRYDGKIGDMVINTLMFREIQKRYPNVKIGVVARGAAKDIIKFNPYVNEIYDYEKGKERELAKEIAEKNYDVLIDFSEMLRVNQMKFINLCKAKINIGLDKEDWQIFDISVTENKDYKNTDHITQRYGAYLKKIGIDDFDKKYDVFLGKNIETRNMDIGIVLNPYGASKHKHFNKETLKFIIEILNSLNKNATLIYSPDKYSELEEFVRENKDLKVYLPQNIKSILDSSEIIKNSDGVITPDTSIVHIASAFNKKIISIYPPNGGKYGVDHLVWGPLDLKNEMLFCKSSTGIGEEININTFDKSQMKERILGEMN
ncbi:glycosyltransferase family 9 protein [Candidatus Cetobacterium colombiensis]|uniref:Glycosyltransferase family 9 protein n=1 Tax=Candidatus Cetobacterium colombiensis TaxID=3073100 RepID=A0ABU4W8S3_9FUSO|nr:glycosyltransferase family 9 protein [Candidatus Cetobacterium colombiensis]MDX8335921.1 glycosyltransferase family 9 protein [Candidatus Cetobacterium colombiensis]